MRTARIDRGEFQRPERTPQGYLRADAYATRVGVFTYRSPDGSVIRELRHPDEVFKPESLATLSAVPVTDEHPPELLTAENTRLYSRGYSSETIEKDGLYVKSRITVTDEELIRQILDGTKRELSCGYQCDLEFTAGVYDGERYDAVQRNIVYNHIAACPKGRAGSAVAVKLDGADVSVMIEPGAHQMDLASLVVGNLAVQVHKDAVAPLTSKFKKDAEDLSGLEAKLAAAQQQLNEVKAELEKAKGTADELTRVVEEQKAEIATKADAMDPKTLSALVRERQKVIAVAEKLITDRSKLNMDSMTDLEIKRAILVTRDPSRKDSITAASVDYVNGRFDAICDTIASDVANRFAENISTSKNDASSGNDNSAAAARARARERDRNAWKPSSL